MHVNQAVKRIDSALDGTFAAIHPQLKWRDGPVRTSKGGNSFTNTENGELTVGRSRYVRTEVSKAKLKKLVAVVVRYWRKAGYKIGDPIPEEPSFSGTASDGCAITFHVNDGDVYFDAAVSAISPGEGFEIDGQEGDKFPKAPNGGPDRTPDVRDPYWSK
ncbi:hypothetical protein ACWGQL_27030 [Streptomyces lydicus]